MRLRLIAYMTILFVFSAGCTLISTSVKIHDFERSEITIPMSITVIENGKVFDTDYFVTRPTFVAHFPPEDCIDCQIAHLADYYPLLALAEKYSFDVLLIVSPSEEDNLRIISSIIGGKFLFPVLVDPEDSFSRLNPDIPSDPRFNHFLIDRDRHPVFVGNPLINTKVYKQFIKKLKSL